MTLEPFTCARVAGIPGVVHAAGRTQIRVGGHPVDLCDWVDDKLYSTVEIGGGSSLHRPLPQFGEFPGERDQYRYRWPDVLRWYVNNAEFERAPNVLAELRKGSRHMTRMLAQTIVLGLAVRPCDKDAVVDMITSTHFGDADSEWALANLIDAAVELAADEHERLAEAWACAARERRWTVPDGAPL